jgi:hypothetical protein
MNIKNRLKTIESRVKINHSPFCACENYAGISAPQTEIVFEKNGVQTIQKPIADFCERCEKRIEKRQIIIQFISLKSEVLNQNNNN